MKQPNSAKLYNTALYMRLSRDDENYGDSVSIETQRTILRLWSASMWITGFASIFILARVQYWAGQAALIENGVT